MFIAGGHLFPSRLEKDRSILYITFFVLVMHTLVMLLMTFSTTPKPVNKPLERMIVKTVSLNPTIRQSKPKPLPIPPPSAPVQEIKEEIIAEAEPTPVAETKPEPAPEPIPAPEPKTEPKPFEKKETPAPVVPPKTETKPKPVTKAKPKPTPKKKEEPVKKPKKKETPKETPKTTPKDTPKPAKTSTPAKPKTETKQPPKPQIDPEEQAAIVKRQQLLESAQKNIAKMTQTRDKISASRVSSGVIADVPGQIESLQIDALPSTGNEKPLSSQEISYRDELAGRLKLLLKLPEYGEVKVKLTLERSGSVAKVVIVSSQSSSNKKYIEKTLPTLKYPSFGDNFGDASQYTFFITLSND